MFYRLVLKRCIPLKQKHLGIPCWSPPQVVAFSLNYHNIYFQKESQENSAEQVPVRAAETCGRSTREAFFN